MNEEVLDIDDNQKKQEFEIASKGQRFANYMVDYILVMLLSVVVIMLIAPNMTDGMTNLTFIIIFVLYYFIFELTLKGKTLGKYITRTRAVTNDYEQISAKQAIGRSLARIIPFEAFSYLGKAPDGWHDRMNNTVVINDRNWIAD